MSYDLYLRADGDDAICEKVLNYLKGEPGYKIQGNQAWFANDDTGVYFSFIIGHQSDEAEDDYDVAFNINYFRPRYFAIEAEPHVKNLVERFGLTVFDPQVSGMGEGSYSTELFFRGWNAGNEFGVSAILSQRGPEEPVYTLPSAKLTEAWRWNLSRSARQQEVGNRKFVPLVMFFDIEGRATTVAIWPDAAPIWSHEVDYFLIIRDQLARKPLFGPKKKDHVLAPWRDVVPVLSACGAQIDGGIDLNYVNPPPEVINFIRRLPATDTKLTRIPADGVLDEEIVVKGGAKT